VCYTEPDKTKLDLRGSKWKKRTKEEKKSENRGKYRVFDGFFEKWGG
jgi:hypothetical protein